MSNKFIFGICCLSALGTYLFVVGSYQEKIAISYTLENALIAGIGAGILTLAYLLVRRHPPAAGDEGENKTPQPPTDVPRPPGALQ